MMITAGSSGILDDDICITDLASAGLPVVSYIRTKIFTLDVSLIKKNIGHLSQKDSLFLKKYLKKLFKYWLQD